MPHALVIGGVSFNTMVYLDTFPQPLPQTIFSTGFHETVGSTGAGKALNLRKLGFFVRAARNMSGYSAERNRPTAVWRAIIYVRRRSMPSAGAVTVHAI